MRASRLSRITAVAPVAAALAAALAVLGCVSAPQAATEQAQPVPAGTRAPREAGPDLDQRDGDQLDADAPAARSQARAGGTGDGTTSVDEFRRDMSTAQRFAEQYWKTALAEQGERFTPVSEVIPYTRDGEVECGGQPIGTNNAAYCSAGDFIAYDINWAYGAFQQVGDAFIYYLLGHEYAHAVQLRLGIRKQFTIQQELQADCMAGAYLGDSQRARKLRVTEADIEEFRLGLEAVGDDPGQTWFAEDSHGTAEQRTQAFVNGYTGSLEPCALT